MQIMLYYIFTITFTVYGKTGRKLRRKFSKRCHAVSANDVNKPVARHFNSGSHSIFHMKIPALCLISVSMQRQQQ
jgi:hypothetical protein